MNSTNAILLFRETERRRALERSATRLATTDNAAVQGLCRCAVLREVQGRLGDVDKIRPC